MLSEPWMTLGVFAGLTRFELRGLGFEGKNKGYKGEFEENFSDSPFVIYVEVCGRVLSGLTGLALFCFPAREVVRSDRHEEYLQSKERRAQCKSYRN